MAMNKQERAQLEAATAKLGIAYALRWTMTEPPKPDLPPPSRSGNGPEYTQGWTFHPHDKGEVSEAWSSSIYHGSGKAPTPENVHRSCGSQGPLDLFSTRALALTAMRYAMEKIAAERLYRVDQLIEEERKTALTSIAR